MDLISKLREREKTLKSVDSDQNLKDLTIGDKAVQHLNTSKVSHEQNIRTAKTDEIIPLTRQEQSNFVPSQKEIITAATEVPSIIHNTQEPIIKMSEEPSVSVGDSEDTLQGPRQEELYGEDGSSIELINVLRSICESNSTFLKQG